jgi:hypothetical protein
LQKLSITCLEKIWVSCFANRPSQLFDGAQKRLTIVLGIRQYNNQKNKIYTTAYQRWFKEEWEVLFRARLFYASSNSYFNVFTASLEKLGSPLELSAFSKIISSKNKLGNSLAQSENYCVYYTRKFGYFLAFLDFVLRITEISSGNVKQPSELKILNLNSDSSVKLTIAALSSSTFFWFWNVLSDCRNLNRRDLLAFPLNSKMLAKTTREKLIDLGAKYLLSLRSSSRIMQKSGLYSVSQTREVQ